MCESRVCDANVSRSPLLKIWFTRDLLRAHRSWSMPQLRPCWHWRKRWLRRSSNEWALFLSKTIPGAYSGLGRWSWFDGESPFFEDFCLQSLGNNAWYMVFTTRPVAESNVMGWPFSLLRVGHQPPFFSPEVCWQIVTFEIIWTWRILHITFQQVYRNEEWLDWCSRCFLFFLQEKAIFPAIWDSGSFY